MPVPVLCSPNPCSHTPDAECCGLGRQRTCADSWVLSPVTEVQLDTASLSTGAHDVLCILVEEYATVQQGHADARARDSNSDTRFRGDAGSRGDVRGNAREVAPVASLGGIARVYVSSRRPSISILSPATGSVLPAPAELHFAHEVEGGGQWGGGAVAGEGEEGEGEVAEEAMRLVMVSVEIELKAQWHEEWGSSAAVHVWAGGQLVSIIRGPLEPEETSARGSGQEDKVGVLHALGSIKVVQCGDAGVHVCRARSKCMCMSCVSCTVSCVWILSSCTHAHALLQRNTRCLFGFQRSPSPGECQRSRSRPSSWMSEARLLRQRQLL
jgi:hypothetical protein